MSQKGTKMSAQDANDLATQIATGKEAKGSLQDAFKAFANAPKESLKTLDRTYYKFAKIGDTYTLLLTGVVTERIKGKDVDVVTLQTADGKNWINGDSMLIDAAKRIGGFPSFVNVTYVGDVQPEDKTMNPYKTLTIQSA